ncbi:MAG TPA: DUF1501 domain-containing protein [Planctomycetota bacterium]|jgi:Protein of unknown function (DUF1501)|nr:DUF1501 domain-containing protein [Planctomycetota bacterium]
MTLTRRELLCRSTLGVGAFALADLMGQAWGDDASALSPLAPKRSHFPGKAKRMIHIFPNGGASHVDTFDPKPALDKYAGKPLPTGNLRTERKTGAAYPSPFAFAKCGESGLEVSNAFPKLRAMADDLCVIRSMYTEVPNHEPSLLMMNCGDIRFSRPSMGSWLTYGLGSENQNLPGFVVLCPGGYPIQESQNWQSSFLPGAYQGTFIDSQHTELPKLIEHIRSDSGTPKDQREQLDLLLELNRRHQEKRREEAALEARIQSFELAYRMQMEAADAFDLSKEPKHVLDLYGPGTQARQMLMARRLLERGVRFVQVWAGAGQPWDNHDKIKENVSKLAGASDQPIAALLQDLRQRGMLEDTLVLWAGEFGRTPTAELPAATGRDHNPYGFSVWLAGGGAKGGMHYGATDEFGFKAEENPVHVHDLHATILHLLGFQHEKFTYRYAGRDFRLTDVHGKVIKEVLA